MALTELQRERIRTRLLEDSVFWARHCCTILDEDKRPVKLEARPWQLDLDAKLQAQHDAGMPMRALILKARKLGFSTLVQAKFVQRLTQQPFQVALAMAQDRKTSGVLADMVSLMYDRLPSEEELGFGFSIRPRLLGKGTTRAGVRFFEYGDPLRPSEKSVYETMTAGAGGVGRGYTPSMFHGSEVAHWQDPEVVVGALNAVPSRQGTIVVLESTANGFNHFHGRWKRAVNGAEDPDTGGLYLPLFYGWQDNPANMLAFPSPEARERFGNTIGDEHHGGDAEEHELIEAYGVTLEQLRWRRNKISEDCEGKIEVFHQEHPATPEQAFIGSGNPVFSGIHVARAIRQADEALPPAEGVLRPADVKEKRTRAGSVLVPGRAIWVPKADMSMDDRTRWGAWTLRVWEHPVNAQTEKERDGEPRPDGQYVAFADIAQGTADRDDPDYSAIQVVDHLTKMQVASYHSRIDIHDYPEIVLLVGLYFNRAWIAPEVTGLGIGVVDKLVKDYRYPRVYRRRRAGDDGRSDTREELRGWATDRRTKPLMEQTMGEAFREETHGLRCVQTARQFTTYVADDRGNHGAQHGEHDDLVMAYMGVQRVASELQPRDPNRRKGPVERFEPFDPLTGY